LAPNLAFLYAYFPTRRKFSDSQKFGGGGGRAISPLSHDATGYVDGRTV